MNEKTKQEKSDARLLCFVGFLLAVSCSYIALKIEWFNGHAPGRLPLSPQSGKWRVSARDEKSQMKAAQRRFKMQMALEAEEKGQDFDFGKPLPPEQQALIQKKVKEEVRKADIDIAFRDFVQSGGLVQTLLAPLLFILGGVCFFRKGWGVKLFGGMYLVIACWAIYLMMSQGYPLGFTGD